MADDVPNNEPDCTGVGAAFAFYPPGCVVGPPSTCTGIVASTLGSTGTPLYTCQIGVDDGAPTGRVAVTCNAESPLACTAEPPPFFCPQWADPMESVVSAACKTGFVTVQSP